MEGQTVSYLIELAGPAKFGRTEMGGGDFFVDRCYDVLQYIHKKIYIFIFILARQYIYKHACYT